MADDPHPGEATFETHWHLDALEYRYADGVEVERHGDTVYLAFTQDDFSQNQVRGVVRLVVPADLLDSFIARLSAVREEGG